MELNKLTFKIRGVAPGLMTHNPIGMLASSNGKPTKGRNIPTAEEEAERGCYRTPEGYCAIRSMAVRGALIRASVGQKVGRKSLKQIVSHIQIEPSDLLVLYNEDETPITEYKIDTQRCVIQRAGIMRSRPLYENWQTTFQIVFDPRMFENPKETFIYLLDDAGARIGLCEYRPALGGPYGRFEVI